MSGGGSYTVEDLRTDQATLMGWEPMDAGRQSPSSMPGWPGCLDGPSWSEAFDSACVAGLQRSPSEANVRASMVDERFIFIRQGYANRCISNPLLFRRVFTYRQCCIRSSISIASAATLSEEISSPLFDLWMPY